MELILYMGISASILVIAVSVICRFHKSFFTQRQRYKLFKIGLILHFIPIPLVIFGLKELYLHFFPYVSEEFFFDGRDKVLTVASNGIYPTEPLIDESLIFFLWCVITIIICAVQIYKRQRFRRIVLQASKEMMSPDILEIRDKYQKQLHLRQKVRIYQTNSQVSPFTIGIFKPIIVLPQIEDSFEKEIAIYHELFHIKNKDGLVLFLRSILIGVYWFNPITYWLEYCLDTGCELACDERIVKGLTKEEKKRYGYFILAVNDDSHYNAKHILAFSNNSKILKERINHIMFPKSTTKKLAVVVSLILCFSSIVPAFAYHTPQIIHISSEFEGEPYLISREQSISFLPFDVLEEEKNKIRFDAQFMDKNGNVYQVTDENLRSIKKNCIHSWSYGTYSRHIKKSDGGCKIDYYDAKKCIKCASTVLLAYQNTHTFEKCPH